MKKEYIYRTNDLYEFNTLEEAKKHAELNESCDTITQYNIFSEDDYEEPKQVWVRESRLVEGTSNFGWVAPLPLLVFYTDDEILSMMDYDDENPRNHYDDYETEDAYYDAVEKYEDGYLNKIGICVLSEDDVDRLDKALDDLNGELKSLSDDFYDQAYELETDEGYEENKEEVDHLYDQSAFLDDVATFRIKSGYYEAAYIDCKNNKEIKDLDKEYQDMIFNKINEIKKEFGLTEMEVTWGPASNGETGYRKVESLKEDEEKKDSIYYCLSDKKMPKHSILLYGEEGRDKLLEIAPKYLEYYGQAEIFKSVNGHKTTIWEDGKLIEEEPTIKIKPDSEKVEIEIPDNSEAGDEGHPIQKGLKGRVGKLEGLKEAETHYDIDYVEGPEGYAKKMDKVGNDLKSVKEKYGIETSYNGNRKIYTFKLNNNDVTIVFYTNNHGFNYDFNYVLVNGKKLDNEKLSQLETERDGDLGDYYALEPTINAIKKYIGIKNESFPDNYSNKIEDHYIRGWHFQVFPERPTRKYWLYNPKELGGIVTYYGEGLPIEKTIGWEGNGSIPQDVLKRVIGIIAKNEKRINGIKENFKESFNGKELNELLELCKKLGIEKMSEVEKIMKENNLKEDISEVGEPKNPVQQGLKGVSKLENLNEAHLDYSDNLGEFIFNETHYWVKGEKSHTRDYHWQEVYIKDTDHNYETVGYGKYKWLNRPWYRFEYDPAFKQAFLRAFGTKYDKFITDIIDSSYSVKDCCEKISKSSENLEDVLEESLKEAFNGEEVFVHVFDIDYYVTEEDVDNESEIEEIKANLPQDLYFSFEEYFEDDSELEERIADAISDETDWLVETFDYELLSEEEYNHYSQLKEEKKKKEKIRFVGNPEKEMAFFNHAMGSDASATVGESVSNECKLKESRDDERVAHYQALLDELYVTPKETELILKTADEYEKNAQRGWISFEEADKITEKLGLKQLSQLDLSRMWEIVYYTLEKAAFENDGENYKKYSDAASAFAEVINMEARRRREHTNSDANLEGIVGDRFAIDNDGLLYLYTSAMKDLIAWAKRRGKSIDELLDMSITKTKDGQTGTLRLKDYSIEFKRLWDQVREKLEIKENK